MHRIIKMFCVMFLVAASGFATGCECREDLELEEISLEILEDKGVSESASDEGVKESSIYVHVCGAVVRPGVYELSPESRVVDALQAAGGVTAPAAADSINQAELLMDGQKIYVPSEAEMQQEASNSADDGKVNVNKASREELMTLSGIGEAKADAIIRYREENGNFSSIEELMEIEGIKEGVFRKIEDQITVS